MAVVTNVLVGLVALLHIYFLVLEMFLWDKPYGLKTFGSTAEFAAASKALAANLGLRQYRGQYKVLANISQIFDLTPIIANLPGYPYAPGVHHL